MKKENPVGWFEIYVDDIDRAKVFYQTVFDTVLMDMKMPDTNDSSMKMASFPSSMSESVGGSAGALVKMSGVCAGGGGTLVYFSSEDCAIEESRIASAGGSVVKPKTSIGQYGFMALATDTEGNMFGIHSMK